MRDLAGRVALVTGASSGIGEAIAVALAREKATLVLVGRDAARLAQAEAACAREGVEAWAEQADLTDDGQMQALADAVHARYPAIDILVNNAGVTMGGLMAEVEIADWRRLLDINVMGVVRGCRL